MSNISISINISGSDLLDVDGNPVQVSGEYSESILLSPFYAMERDILVVFAEDAVDYTSKVREYIFEASLEVDSMLSPMRQKELCLTDEQAFMLKRHYVICAAVYKFGLILFRDFMKSVKKSKFLADIKVSLEIERDPKMINLIVDDARECTEELKGMFSIGMGMASFVKGQYNPCNKTSHRQWWPSEGGNRPMVPIAATKAANFCSLYKIGRS